MTARKTSWKTRRPTSLAEAFDLDEAHALQVMRRPRKQMEELMDVPRSTYARWIADADMPTGRLRQFSALCGSSYVIEYLGLAAGKIVIDIPTGRNTVASDIHQLQTVLNEAVGQILKFASGQLEASDALAAIQSGMAGLAWHKVNIEKHQQPELELGDQ